MSKKRITIDYPIYKIVADGGLASPIFGEGRFIPALIIDIGEDKDVPELIKLHNDVPPGDTLLLWALQKSYFSAPKALFLNIEFIRPMRIRFAIKFDLSNQSAVVDGIIQSRAFYLITGKLGDKISEQLWPKVLVEVPNMEFDNKWNDMLVEIVKKKYRKMGESRKEVREHVDSQIKSMRDFWRIRMSE